jgi:hypothetical protein
MGFIFYETVFGRSTLFISYKPAPWTAKTQMELLNNIKNQSLTFPAEINCSNQTKKLIAIYRFHKKNRGKDAFIIFLGLI